MARRLNQLYRLEFASGKSYIGVSTESASRRYSSHQKEAKRGYVLPVYSAWRKHDAPKLFVLATVERFMLPDTERKAIKIYKTLLPSGYNCVPGGDVSPSTHPEVAKKISIALKGRIRSPEHCANISKAALGRKYSAEIRAKWSKARKGRKHSEETRKKIGKAHRGKVRSLTARANMSAGKKAKGILRSNIDQLNLLEKL